MNKNAFTLAELLITMVVLGIIASLTIPSILNIIPDTRHKLLYKSSFSIISAAASKVITDNGGTAKQVCGDWDFQCLRDKFKIHMSWSKVCDAGDSLGKCWHLNDGSSKTMSGIAVTDWPNRPGLVLNNSMLMMFNMGLGDCSGQAVNYKYCAFIYLDTNGFKKPNVIGEDIFRVWFQENRILPMGIVDDGYTGTCTKMSSGQGCGALYLRQ